MLYICIVQRVDNAVLLYTDEQTLNAADSVRYFQCPSLRVPELSRTKTLSDGVSRIAAINKRGGALSLDQNPQQRQLSGLQPTTTHTFPEPTLYNLILSYV